jgi:mono/diheme cytochrome c family protein
VKQPPRARARAVWLRRVLLSPALLTLFACNSPPPDLREWRVSDHDHTENPGAAQVQVDPKATASAAAPGLEDVTLVSWEQNCVQCHGRLGMGDGPRGPMLKATNLASPSWQASVTDEQIATSIKLGRGSMPAFNLPDVTIANLVKLVRMMGASSAPGHGAPGRASAAPSASSAPSASAAKGKTPPTPAAPRASASAAPN